MGWNELFTLLYIFVLHHWTVILPINDVVIKSSRDLMCSDHSNSRGGPTSLCTVKSGGGERRSLAASLTDTLELISERSGWRQRRSTGLWLWPNTHLCMKTYRSHKQSRLSSSSSIAIHDTPAKLWSRSCSLKHKYVLQSYKPMKFLSALLWSFEPPTMRPVWSCDL